MTTSAAGRHQAVLVQSEPEKLPMIQRTIAAIIWPERDFTSAMAALRMLPTTTPARIIRVGSRRAPFPPSARTTPRAARLPQKAQNVRKGRWNEIATAAPKAAPEATPSV